MKTTRQGLQLLSLHPGLCLSEINLIEALTHLLIVRMHVVRGGHKDDWRLKACPQSTLATIVAQNGDNLPLFSGTLSRQSGQAFRFVELRMQPCLLYTSPSPRD